MQNLSIILGIIILIITILIIVFKKKKISTIIVQSTQSTPTTGNTNPPSAGHATTPSKKQGVFAKIVNIMGFIILIVVVIVIVVWAIGFVSTTIKSIFKSSPKYYTVWVKVREKTINLGGIYNNTDTITMQYGQKCRCENATVPFCVMNNAGEEVCTPAFTDPTLTGGIANENLWFKNQDGNLGTVKVVVSERRQKLIQ